MTTLTTNMATVRKHMDERLTPMFIKLLYKESFKVYISFINKIYNVHYNKLSKDNMNYHGLYCFVMLKNDEMVLCKLTLYKLNDLTYDAKELSIAFKRCLTRTLRIDENQIISYLLPCSNK